MGWVDALIATVAIGLFLATLLAIVWCIDVFVTRKRFTLKLLLVAVTASCVLAGFASIGREAARKQRIATLTMQRAFYLEHRSSFDPKAYDELMKELDAEAARLGVDKQHLSAQRGQRVR